MRQHPAPTTRPGAKCQTQRPPWPRQNSQLRFLQNLFLTSAGTKALKVFRELSTANWARKPPNLLQSLRSHSAATQLIAFHARLGCANRPLIPGVMTRMGGPKSRGLPENRCQQVGLRSLANAFNREPKIVRPFSHWICCCDLRDSRGWRDRQCTASPQVVSRHCR